MNFFGGTYWKDAGWLDRKTSGKTLLRIGKFCISSDGATQRYDLGFEIWFYPYCLRINFNPKTRKFGKYPNGSRWICLLNIDKARKSGKLQVSRSWNTTNA